MPYDEEVAGRVREALDSEPAVVEKKMFGGLSFMVRGHMCCGVSGEELMVRVGPDAYENALSRPDARKMDFTGKPLIGFVYVRPDGIRAKADLQTWVDLGLEFVRSLPGR